jgi:peptide/nickel transport system substrate-binding protein
VKDVTRSTPFSRRTFLRFAKAPIAGVLATPLLAACATPAPAPTPTAAPQAPASAPPAAAQPTTAPPAATQPTTAPTPAPKPAVPTPAPKPAAGSTFMRAPEGSVKRGGVARGAWLVSTPHYDMHQGAAPWNIGMLYNNLVRLNLADGLRSIIPDLAERWEISPDGKTYSFHLRDGVKFHDGTPLTAADVQASFQRIISPPAGMVSIFKDLFESVDGVEAVDRLTARFTLKEARPWLLEVFTNPGVVVYSKKSLDANNNDIRRVIVPGTGAFMHKDVRDGEKWTLVKNPNYWDPELPYVDGFEILHAAEWTDRGTAVLTGQADVTQNTSVEMVLEAQKRPDIVQGRQVPSTGMYYVLYNTKKKPLDDARVRRAINLALSHQDLITVFGKFEGVKFSSWLPRASDFARPPEQLDKMPGYRADKSADIAEAKKLMAEAGVGSGIQGLDLLCASVASHAQVLAPAIQEQLKRTLNIEAKIRVVERIQIGENLQKGAYDLCVSGANTVATLDPSPLWTATLKTGATGNLGFYSNAQFDKLVSDINRSIEPTKRREMVDQAQTLLDQDPPYYVIGWVDHNLVWRNYVKGIAYDKRVVNEIGRLETIWFDK